jgi:hypothetical protein
VNDSVVTVMKDMVEKPYHLFFQSSSQNRLREDVAGLQAAMATE